MALGNEGVKNQPVTKGAIVEKNVAGSVWIKKSVLL
jgi:hypothetical protein